MVYSRVVSAALNGLAPERMHGLVLGKFLPYHAGHAHLIRHASARADQVTVLVCSIAREPVPGNLRYQWVRDAHPECRVVHVAEEVPQAPDEDPDFWSIWRDLIARYAGKVDVVFTSESYGEELGRHLGARHICVDRERVTYPVSGTAVRAAPLAYWDYLPPPVRAHYVPRIAIIGAESTGKSTMAERLAQRFTSTWVPEYGRKYCEGLDARDLTLADFDAIAAGQAASEDALALAANRVLFCDTELHTTAVWSDMVAGRRPAGLTAAARARRYELMLLLADDVPWIDDGTRVFADRRAEHTRRLRAELSAAGRTFVILTGTHEQRESLAARLTADLLHTKGADLR